MALNRETDHCIGEHCPLCGGDLPGLPSCYGPDPAPNRCTCTHVDFAEHIYKLHGVDEPARRLRAVIDNLLDSYECRAYEEGRHSAKSK